MTPGYRDMGRDEYSDKEKLRQQGKARRAKNRGPRKKIDSTIYPPTAAQVKQQGRPATSFVNGHKLSVFFSGHFGKYYVVKEGETQVFAMTGETFYAKAEFDDEVGEE